MLLLTSMTSSEGPQLSSDLSSCIPSLFMFTTVIANKELEALFKEFRMRASNKNTSQKIKL